MAIWMVNVHTSSGTTTYEVGPATTYQEALALAARPEIDKVTVEAYDSSVLDSPTYTWSVDATNHADALTKASTMLPGEVPAV